MLAFLARHSALFLFIAAVIGFAFPHLSLALFPYLPYVLFALMLFTLLGINQSLLVKALGQWRVWLYAFVHAVVLTIVTCTIAWGLGASDTMLLAISGICATGSLFATPAIIRSLEMDALIAMAYTIASTLLMPIVLFINLSLLSGEAFSLDLHSYIARLVIFIFGPMGMAALFHAWIKPEKLKRIHGKLAQFTIVLVFSFPLGLVGPIGAMWQKDSGYALELLAISVALCMLFFAVAYIIYRRYGEEASMIAAVTAVNRNVLLTYTVAGAALGPVFLPLIGAIQLPIYLQPLLVRWGVRLKRASHNATTDNSLK
ncbi:hypothetical protein [Salinivibrio proteolyticus]|uniref:hypothetical protein n=1 Tax=Salinivibrio proteolyticus TaxID=334715 RepID=UPI001E320A48|nr:hypothetical protein [Salinivibrio proteolyticus]